MKISSAVTVAVFLLGAAMVGCSSARDAANTSAPADTTAAAAESTSAPQDGATPESDAYPDWAAATVADYPNRVDQQTVTTNFYQIDSPDDLAAVYAWYKAHTTGGTWKPSDPDSPAEWFFTGANGVHIDIQANHYPGGIAKTTKTMIAFTLKK
jgi:hypothetical protein